MNRIEDFFADLDRAWPGRPEPKIELSLIGCGALMLQANYERGTKDSDVFETLSLTKAIQATLLAVAGRDTPLYHRHKLYVDVVANGIPFLPEMPIWHRSTELNARMTALDLRVLDVVDVVVSKLKRFSANDIADIDAMVELGLVPHPHLVERFRSAFDQFSFDARAADLPRYVENLHQVERDMLGEPETEIDLSALRY